MAFFEVDWFFRSGHFRAFGRVRFTWTYVNRRIRFRKPALWPAACYNEASGGPFRPLCFRARIMLPTENPFTVPTKYWHRLDDGRVQCDLCPRWCKLHEGQRGFCFVRACQEEQIVLTSYGRSSGFCVDPIEKKPLYHFLPGTPVLSFGT